MDQPLQSSRIEELEGVRAFLALWVFVFHVLSIGGFEVHDLLDGKHAVGVFFAMSGFVIARLLHLGGESYGVFIARRFLRLYPSFVLCVGASIVLIGLGIMPGRHEQAPMWLHLLLHGTMLHGAIPESLAPGSRGAFLNPAWSVSVEWQFYLLVPLFFAAYKRRPSMALAGLAGLAILASRTVYGFGFGGASVFAQASLFTYGIVTYLIYDWAGTNVHIVRQFSRGLPLLLPLLFMLVVSISQHVALVIWLGVFGWVLDARVRGDSDGLVPQPLIELARTPAFVALGAASYALYLVHEPLIWLTLHAVQRAAPGTKRGVVTAVLGLVTLPVSLVLSLWMHRYVEAPCIRFGRLMFSS